MYTTPLRSTVPYNLLHSISYRSTIITSDWCHGSMHALTSCLRPLPLPPNALRPLGLPPKLVRLPEKKRRKKQQNCRRLDVRVPWAAAPIEQPTARTLAPLRPRL